MTIGIIGLGLIGGSMSLSLKKVGFASKVLGWDISSQHMQEALHLGLIDELAETLPALVHQSELIIIATPVNVTPGLVENVLDHVKDQVVMDVGSVKSVICNQVSVHRKRSRFVATHPMWGTEYSGPMAATTNAFAGKAAVICESNLSAIDAVELVEHVYTSMKMHVIRMNPAEHDLHAAYISHVSHITSFALANTVLEKEKEDDKIFELASGGFESTVRLAKSHAAMWVPIFQQNKDNVLDVLNEHISQLKKFKSCLEKDNFDYLEELITHANTIKRILK